MDRISFENLGILLSLAASLKSEDKFTQVGCAGFDRENRIVGISYNGYAKGQILSEEFLEDRDNKNLFVRHSETNLLSMHKKGDIHTMFLTCSPCRNCAVNIAAHEIKKIIFLEEYHREQDYKKVFDFYKIEYKCLDVREIKILRGFLNEMDKKLKKVFDDCVPF